MKLRRLRPCLLALGLLLACGDKAEGLDSGDGSDPDGDDGLQCGSTQGFVYGFLSGGTDPTVIARDGEGQEIAADWYGDPAAEGTPYELNLPEGAWVLTASATGCSDRSAAVEVEACFEYGVSIALDCR